MTLYEAEEIVTVLASAYPLVVGRFSETQARAWLTTYSTAIVDLDYETTKKAAARLIKTSPWVSIAELRAAVVDVVHGQARTGAEAWGDVLAKIGRYGMNRPPLVDDGERKPWRFDDELINLLADASTWREWCLSENQAADRARFIDAYDRMAKQGRLETQASDGAARLALPSRDRTGGPARFGDAIRGQIEAAKKGSEK